MDGEKFRQIIQLGTNEYGSEIWFFLRELAQNSRDAGADHIRVTAGYLNGNTEFIRFEDDGIGMSRNHANDYLFKLYASSKENQKHSIGKYGIGFWTVLKFNPYKIIIESKFKKEGWAVQLNSRLETEMIPPTMKKKGTKITLLRISESGNPENYLNTVKREITKYCKYLTKENTFEPLPVLFNNDLINKKMELPGILSRKIIHKSLAGVVALSKEPKVVLYSKGLPVWKGSVLSDLTDHSQNNKTRFETGKGLAPVFLLNSSNIDINFSRNIPIDNTNLTKMINRAEEELSKLIFTFIKKTTPWSFFNNLNSILKKTINRIKKSLFIKLFFLLILLIPIEVYLLNSFFSKSDYSKSGYKSDSIEKRISNYSKKTSSSLLVEDDLYSGASVHSGKTLTGINISFTPKNDALFKLYPADKYDIKRGFVYTDPTPLKIDETFLKKEGISIIIANAEKGRSFLLSKNNFRIDRLNLKINGKIIDETKLEYLDDNTVQINLTHSNNLIEYQIYPKTSTDSLTENDKKKYLTLPDIALPDYLVNSIKEIENLSLLEKINKIEVLTRELLKYDNSRDIIEKYQIEQNSDWLKKVLKIKAGDCDVINGINTLLLRKVNIPSRLVIGFIGKKGKILPELHAWTEYYNKGWQAIDVSTISQNSAINAYSSTQTEMNKTETTELKTKENKTPENKGFFQIIIIVFFVLSPLFLVIFIVKTQINKNFEINNGEMAQSLGKIAVNALIYPEIWQSMYIWNYKFIPTLGHKHISLEDIIHKAKNRLLYKSSISNSLLNKHNVKHLYILDSNDKYYSNLIKTIPGIIDLNKIRELEIKNIKEADIRIPYLKNLLKEVEFLLDKTTNGILKIFISFNLNSQCFLNIELSKYIPPYSDQFVLINPMCDWIENFINDSSNMKYSVFKIIEKILENYDIQQNEINLIKKRISKLLLKREI